MSLPVWTDRFGMLENYHVLGVSGARALTCRTCGSLVTEGKLHLHHDWHNRLELVLRRIVKNLTNDRIPETDAEIIPSDWTL